MDHPHDPADLLRCLRYCDEAGITDTALRRRMKGRSPQWDALLPHWPGLRAMLYREMESRSDGRAPGTYAQMRLILAGVR